MRLFLFGILLVFLSGCQTTLIDGSIDELERSQIGNSVDSLIRVSNVYFSSSEFKDSLFDIHLQQAYELAVENNLDLKVAEIYTKVGKRYRNKSDFGVALYFYQKLLEMSNRLENERMKAYAKAEMAVVFRRLDDNAKALNLHFQALEWAESARDTFLILASNNGIGNVYFSFNNLPKAIEYFHNSLQILSSSYTNKLSKAINTNNIGEAWLALGNSDSALYYVNKSYDINMEMGSKLGQAICKNGLGDIYVYLKNYNLAILNYKESLFLNREVGNLIYVASNLFNLGKAYLLINNFSQAEEYLLEALAISKEIGSKSKIVQIQSSLSTLYRKSGNKDKALFYLDEAMIYKDTITHEVSRLNSEGMNALYKTEKQEREIVILKQKDELSQLLLNRQQWFMLGGLIIILGGIIFLIYAFYQRRVTAAYSKQIENQNKNIRDSIRYAEKIQSAILPDHEHLAKSFDDYFVFYKPRDIVSGDFYWFTRREESTIVVTSDCTGHGVPGALMSMLGVAFLNEIVNKEGIIEPHLILNRLREQIISQLKQKGNIHDSKDGMDLSIYVVNHQTNKLKYSGAYSPVYIIRNNELTQLKSDRMPIGYHPKKNSSFTMQEFTLQKGDCIYSSTDGYSDQFGGVDGSKFMMNSFKKLLLDIHKKPMKEQRNILNNQLVAWRRDIEQIDDIVIIGIRI